MGILSATPNLALQANKQASFIVALQPRLGSTNKSRSQLGSPASVWFEKSHCLLAPQGLVFPPALPSLALFVCPSQQGLKLTRAQALLVSLCPLQPGRSLQHHWLFLVPSASKACKALFPLGKWHTSLPSLEFGLVPLCWTLVMLQTLCVKALG